MNFEFSPLLRGYLAAGYEHVEFEQEGFDELDAAVFKGELQWLPTKLMTVYLGAERLSTLTGFGTSSLRLDTIYNGKVEYEIWRNLVLTASAKYTVSEYRESDREDEVLLAGVGLEYLINKNFHATARYDYRERTSTVDEFNNQGSTYMLGLSLKY